MIQTYLVILISLFVIDFIWLSVVAKNFYQSEFGSLMRDKFLKLPASLFYLIYPVAIYILVVIPAVSGIWSANALLDAAGLGGLLGSICYGTYNFTNMSTLKGWSWKLVLVDLAWGTVATATVALIGTYAFLK